MSKEKDILIAVSRLVAYARISRTASSAPGLFCDVGRSSGLEIIPVTRGDGSEDVRECIDASGGGEPDSGAGAKRDDGKL